MLELNRNTGHIFWKVKRCEDTKGANVEAQIKMHIRFIVWDSGKDTHQVLSRWI